MKTNVSHLLLVAGLALGAAGCTTVQVTDDTRGEVRLHEVQVFVDADFQHAYDAASAGVADKHLFVVKNEKQPNSAEIKARDAGDTLVTVKVGIEKDGRTSIKIRYGLPGNVAEAQNLYKSIQAHL